MNNKIILCVFILALLTSNINAQSSKKDQYLEDIYEKEYSINSIQADSIRPLAIDGENTTVTPKIKDNVYKWTDQMPKFPGGDAELMKFIKSNLKYPTIEGDNTQTQGRVILSFVIDKDGNVIDAEIIQSLGFYFDKEAIRLINSMPAWTPGKNNGKPVNVYYTMSIVFHRPQ